MRKPIGAVRTTYNIAYIAVALLFGVCGVGLIAFATVELWHGLNPHAEVDRAARFRMVLESVGILTIAVASLELSQTVMEEEVQRSALMSAPTRVRRFLSRFMVVIVVSLSIEFLVVVFGAIHTDQARLPHAAALGAATAALLAAWGLFVRLNRSAEELEPDALAEAKREDEDMG